MKNGKQIIKAVFLHIFVGILRFVYLFIKILPSGKKILFISRQSNICSMDFEMLIERFKCELPEYNLIVLTKRINNKAIYFIDLIKQMYHIATARACIIDSYSIPISVLKHKKTLKVVQIWHSMGAIKQFGFQCVGKSAGRDEVTTKVLKMHNNYNLIFSGSKAMIEYYSKAFNYDENRFLVNNLPRMDYINNNINNKSLKDKISQKYPGIFEKKTILYVPTFRKKKNYFLKDLIDNIDFTEFNLIVKFHPNKKQEYFDNRVYFCKEFSSIELMLFSDCLITDYSAISIEASGLGIPVYFYLYDYEEYIISNGLNIDLPNDYPGLVFRKAKNILINYNSGEYDYSQLEKFNRRFISGNINNATEQMVKKIISEFRL